jgi:hypothetical protein
MKSCGSPPHEAARKSMKGRQMKPTSKFNFIGFIAIGLVLGITIVCAQEPRPSWNDATASESGTNE